MDYESSSDEDHDEDFQINKESHFPLSPNLKDYEINSDKGQDEARSPNLKDYESSSDKGQDVEFSVSK